jgi:hypothetical protein
MNNRAVFLSLLAVLALVGCGGSSVSKTSIVTGTVYDANLDPVIGATVSTGTGASATTSASGAFALTNQPEGAIKVDAEIFKNGVKFHGSTTVFNSSGTQSTSVGIMMARQSDLASVAGIVTNRAGDPIENAVVLAYTNQGGTSQRAVTDDKGEYRLYDLVSGINYTLSAVGQTFRSDSVTRTFAPGEDGTEDFNLGVAGTPVLASPTNLSAVTYVSFANPSSKAVTTSASDWVKRHMDTKPAGHAGRSKATRAIGDLMIEAQLDWVYAVTSETQGYGIYRSPGNVSTPTGYDFFYDPLASTFFDNDNGLQPLSTYTYAVTSTSSRYPDDPTNTQSALSNRALALTLDRLNLGTYNRGTFTWSGSSKATSYIVYVFDELPSIERSPYASNETSRVSGTSWVYDGPALVSGRTYYWFVLGLANSDSSRTISQIASFKA